MSIKTIIIILLILTPIVLAADWVPVSVKYNWDRRSTGFCKETSQCLVKNAFNDSLDNQPEKYWTGIVYMERPKCIQDGQYISDYYCEMGEWTTRTKLIAQQLLEIAGNNNYALYCDDYNKVLNKYEYNTDYGTVATFLLKYCTLGKHTENCANNICVMRYGDKIAFGMSINTDISGTKSPLQALNMNKNECDEAKETGGYRSCGNNVWYNHDTQSIIYAPGVSPMPAVQTDILTEQYEELKDYVSKYVHDPNTVQYNYTFYDITPQFNYIYIAKENDKMLYSFKQTNMSHNMISTDYAGWHFSNIDLPIKTCDRYIKKYDSRASCEEQPEDTEFYIAAYKKPPANPKFQTASIIDVWPDTTGKLRVI